MNIRAILEWDSETQSFSASYPELNFISSCGDTKEEALENLKEAIELLLEPIPQHSLETQTKSEVIELVI